MAWNTSGPLAVVACLLALSSSAPAADALPLIDFAKPGSEGRCTAGCDQVIFARSDDPAKPGLAVTIAPGKAGYPGIHIKPEGQVWDLSSFGHVAARITNLGEKAISLSLRVDNTGDWQAQPWNTESGYIKPGETGTVKVIFGFQYGTKPGYKLDSAKVVNLLLFTGKAKAPVSFRVESIIASGAAGERPPVDPKDVRTKPLGGYLLGGAVTIDAAKQIEAKNGAAVKVVALGRSQALHLTYPAGKGTHLVRFKPPIGRWDLTGATEIRLRVKNVGEIPVTPGARVTSDRWHGTDMVLAETALVPGASQELVVDFAADKVWQGPTGAIAKAHAKGQKGTGTSFAGNKADAVEILAKHAGEAALLVESITATVTPLLTPAWLGKRPPAEGKWALTFRDEFDGETIDRERWNIYTENYWDKRSHFTKDNVVLGDGTARLRMERKTGHENDDPKRKKTGHAVGFLDTYGRWAQRYGYFEARMKLPTAPGLWPAFWLMPDRGPVSDPQWVRANTGKGAMEFDIMEHLTRWGPYRYNVAMHWDGYGKEHKSIGSSNVYVRPDADGFITSGLLWTPGAAVYYCNGEVVARLENTRISNVASYPILYMVTGGWDNSPVDDDQLPADFVVDYVRIWQRQDLASAADGKIALARTGPRPKAPNAPPATGEILTTAAAVKPAEIELQGATVRVVENKGTKVLQATFPAGTNYPTFTVPVTKGGWDLSAFAGAQVEVVNTGQSEVAVCLRVDNLGDWRKEPWNVEKAILKPGEAQTIQVVFGKSYGGKPGFALDSGHIVAFRVFAEKPKQTATVIVRNLKAFGTP